jgi:hypothetical protein
MLVFDNIAPPSAVGAQQGAVATTISQGVKNTRLESSFGDLKFSDKEPRHVTEIRVYYDDQTYETFVPAKK